MNDNDSMTPDELKDWVEGSNAAALQCAQDRFTAERGSELAGNCAYLTEETAKRYLRIKGGKTPIAFGEFDRDEIARTLAADVIIKYDGYMYEDGGFYDTTWETEAIETWDRRKFVEAYDKYLGMAEAFARKHGNADAARYYREARQAVKDGSQPFYRTPLPPDEALRVVELETAASLSFSRTGKGAAK